MGKATGILITVILAALLFWLLSSRPAVAPTPEDGGTPPAPGTAPKKAFKVALITKGEVNDGGWFQNAYNGLQRIGKDLGAEVKNSVRKDDKSAFEQFASYGAEGQDLVIGHASEWFDPKLVEQMSKFPDTQVFISGSEKPAEGNVCGIRFVLEDACYVLGYLAGSMSKSGVLGCVGPVKLTVIESTFHAFEAGAKRARSDIVVRVVWTDSWDDVARAKEQTLALIAEKADFIFHNANNGAPGVFQAVHEHKDEGVLAFGANDDQAAMDPEVVLASAVLDIPAVFVKFAREVRDGTFDGKTKFEGMPERNVRVVYNPAIEKRIPAGVREKADRLAEEIADGTVKADRLQAK